MIDLLTDAFRWWSSGGAASALPFVLGGIIAMRRGGLERDHSMIGVEVALTLSLAALAAILIAGAIIPWATDNRVLEFDRESAVYRSVLMCAWMGWGIFAWGLAVWLTHSRWKMLLASAAWLSACVLAAERTVGVAL